mgnify:CR=1 FL=1
MRSLVSSGWRSSARTSDGRSDGFDYTILTFLLVDVQRSFAVNATLAGLLGQVTLMFRVAGGIGAGTAADRWGRKGPLMFFDSVVLRVRVPQRLLDDLRHAVRVPRAVRHRHGRRVGRGHAADARALAGEACAARLQE